MIRRKVEAHAKSCIRAAAPRRRLSCDWWDNFGLNPPGLGVCSHPLGTVPVQRREHKMQIQLWTDTRQLYPGIKKCGAPYHQYRAMEHLGSLMIPFHFIV